MVCFSLIVIRDTRVCRMGVDTPHGVFSSLQSLKRLILASTIPEFLEIGFLKFELNGLECTFRLNPLSSIWP